MERLNYNERRNALEALFWEQWGRGYFCDAEMNFKFYSDDLKCATLEHLLPKSKGGSNFRENLACACFECNQLKSNMTEAEFAEWIKSLCFV